MNEPKLQLPKNIIVCSAENGMFESGQVQFSVGIKPESIAIDALSRGYAIIPTIAEHDENFYHCWILKSPNSSDDTALAVCNIYVANYLEDIDEWLYEDCKVSQSDVQHLRKLDL